ncbi:MAG: outer membrane beta-barrel protein [Endomicrobia bacterium]|nr:outer membrane beta-barrel protein [Endomicrobiia bacterium]MCL2506244.1 outer membrane beta-barrel protein [Endomicrobiia bacterium]
MKKLILTAFCLAVLANTAFAKTDNSTVYISASLSQAFSHFALGSFADSFFNKSPESDSMFDGARYDFSMGYRLGSKVRIEGQYIIISENSFETDHANLDIKYKSTAIFANLIYDFWNAQKSLLTPFLGIGIGLGSPNLKWSVADLQKEKDTNGFSWQFQCGINVKIVDWLLVNAKYTYLAMPGINNPFESGTAGTEDVINDFKKGVQGVGVGITLLL